MPSPATLAGAPSEATEASLVTIRATVDTRPAKSTSGDLSFLVTTAAGTQIRVMADASSGIAATSIAVGAEGRFVGIVGQRATKKGALDGYRVWVRDPRDLALTGPTPSGGSPTPAPSGGPGSTPTPSAGGATIAIATALGRDGAQVAISGVVTAGGTLLDASGRRIVVQDGSAAVEVLVPTGVAAPSVGERVRVSGAMGAAYGSPRLRAASLETLGRGSMPAALAVRGPFSSAHRWRLVRIEGRIEDVAKLGDRWRAEVAVGSSTLLVVGQPGAGIPVATMIEGRQVMVVGIVRAAYPTASDQRATLLPRSTADVRVAGSAGASGGGGAGGGSGTGGGGAGGPDPAPSATPSSSAAPTDVVDADLADLAAYVGQTVRVGGLVAGADR